MQSRFSENATGRVASNPFNGSDNDSSNNYGKHIRHSALDPSDEMQSTLSQLTARARQLAEHYGSFSHIIPTEWHECNAIPVSVTGDGLTHIPPITQNVHGLRAMASKASNTLSNLTNASTCRQTANVLPSSSA